MFVRESSSGWSAARLYSRVLSMIGIGIACPATRHCLLGSRLDNIARSAALSPAPERTASMSAGSVSNPVMRVPSCDNIHHHRSAWALVGRPAAIHRTSASLGQSCRKLIAGGPWIEELVRLLQHDDERVAVTSRTIVRVRFPVGVPIVDAPRENVRDEHVVAELGGPPELTITLRCCRKCSQNRVNRISAFAP